MATATTNPHMKSTAVMRAFAAAVRANVPVYFQGDPGEGKSAKISAYGEAWGMFVKVLMGNSREATDFLGLPTEDPETKTTTYLPPHFAYEVNHTAAPMGAMLMLDELTTVDESTQKAMLRLVEERWAGDYRLADHVRIVAAGNPPESAADGRDLTAPLANRFMHLTWEFDVEEWMSGVLDDFASQTVYTFDQMLNAGTDSDIARAKGLVTGFLKSAGGLNHLRPGAPKDEVNAGKAWASPRSWTNAMRVLGHLRPEDDGAMFEVIRGCVGGKAATDFTRWIATADLWDPADVIADPSIVGWSTERPDRLFALTMGIEALARLRNDKDTWTGAMRALTKCAEARRADVALPSVRSLANRMPSGATIPRTTREAFTDLFQRTGEFAAPDAA